MQTFQRKLRFHKFVSEIIVGILVLTNVLAITPLASTTVALAQDSGVSFPTVKDLDWGKVYDDRTLRKENIDLDNMVELLENNTSSYVSELATKNQKLANWLKDNDNRSDFIKELQAYPGYDPDTPLTVMMLNEVTQAVIDSMIAQSCVTCSCNTVTGLHAYQVDLLDFILENIQQSGRQFEVDGLEDRLTQILARSRNDCADLEMQRPQIAFANEVLVQFLAKQQGNNWREYTPGYWGNIDQIYSDFPELLKQSYQEYLHEFGVDRAVVETILAQEPISQTIFAQTLGLEVSDLDLLDLEKVTYSQLFNDTRNIGNVFTQPESKDLYRLLVKSKANLLYQTLANNLREQVYQERLVALTAEQAITNTASVVTPEEQSRAEALHAVEDARSEKQEDAQSEAEIIVLAVQMRVERTFLPAARRHLITKILEQFKAKNDALTKKVYDVQTLGDYLSVDLASDISIETSRTAFAVESLQTLVQSLLLGRESATEFKAPNFNNDRWRWTRSYGVWKAAMTVYLYPEDFLLPELRVPYWSNLFNEMVEKFDEVPNLATAQAALTFFADEVNNLSHLDSVANLQSVSTQDGLYFFLRSPNGMLYFSMIDQQENWQDWKPIELDVNNQTDSQPEIVELRQAFVVNNKIYLFYEAQKSLIKTLVLSLNGTVIDNLEVHESMDEPWYVAEVRTPDIAFLTVINRTLYSMSLEGQVTEEYEIPFSPNYKLVAMDTFDDGIYFVFLDSSDSDDDGYSDRHQFRIYRQPVKDILDGIYSYRFLWTVGHLGNYWLTIPVDGVGYPESIQLSMLDPASGKFILSYQQLAIKTPELLPPHSYSTGVVPDFTKSLFDSLIDRQQWRFVVLRRNGPDSSMPKVIDTIDESDVNTPKAIQDKYLIHMNTLGNKLFLVLGTSLVQFPWKDEGWRNANNWVMNGQLFPLNQDREFDLQNTIYIDLKKHFAESQSRDLSHFTNPKPAGEGWNDVLSPVTDNAPFLNDLAKIYSEELYFHLPTYLAGKLNEAGKYEDAALLYRLTCEPSAKGCQFLYRGFEKGVQFISADSQPSTQPTQRSTESINRELNPHHTAQNRSLVYNTYVWLKSVENLLDWADAEFVHDTRESVAHARELYETAQAILPTLPFEACQVPAQKPSANNSLFTNEAAFARGFCIPVSLTNYTLQLRVDANLLKIRTGRNFAGIQRQIVAQTTDVDPRLVAQSTTSDNADLDSLIPSEPPSVYRYSYLVERARQLTAQAQHLEAYLLSTLEKLDDENYALLQAKNDLKLKRGQVAVEALRVKEAQQQTNLATIQQERAQFSQEHFDELLSEGESTLEIASLVALHYSIGAASSVGVGTKGPSTTWSPQGALQALSQEYATAASWERRAQEWQYQENMAAWDVKIAEAGIAMAEVNEEISQKQRDLAALSSELSEETVDFLTEGQFTNAVLYRWMKKELRKLYRQQLNMATATARAAQRALAFELQEPLDFIAPQYVERQPTENREGLLAAEKLLFDLERLEQHRIERAERRQEITKVISLARMMPSEFQQFRQTGVLNFDTLMEWFDRDFPGGYMRMIKSVEMTVIALTPPGDSIHATLTNQGLSRIMVGSPWVEPKVIQRMPEMIALSSPIQASGLFELRLDDPMLLPFEGSGVETSWTFEMSPAANALDFNTISDIWMTIRYTAKSDPDYRTKVIDRMESTFQGRVFYGMRESFADAWYQFHNPRFFADASAYTDQGQPLPYSLAFTLDRTFFPPNEEQIKLTKVTLASQQSEPFTFTVPISVTFMPEGTQAKQRATGKLEDGVWSFGIFSGTIPTGAWTIAVDVAVCGDTTKRSQFVEFCRHAKQDNTTGQWVLDNTNWLENLLLIFDYSAKLRYARP